MNIKDIIIKNDITSAYMPSIDKNVVVSAGPNNILVYINESDDRPTLILDEYGTMRGYSDVIIQPSKNTTWSDYIIDFEVGELVIFKDIIYIIETIERNKSFEIDWLILFDPINNVREVFNYGVHMIKATPDVIDHFNMKLHRINKHYSSKKFITDWFNTYDKVLVKSNDDDVWFATIFSYYNKDKKKFVDISGKEWDFCKIYKK